jgi:DNA-binding transcriptional LysR family regulator
MSSAPGTPTLDQLRVFLTVIDVGSFAGAARKLGRATSVISYSIANLEAQLGVLRFDRESTRRPRLTEAGRTVLSDARTITNGINGLRQGERLSRASRQKMLPASRVVDALKVFERSFRPCRCASMLKRAVTQTVLDRTAMIGICGLLEVEVAGIERIGVGSVDSTPLLPPIIRWRSRAGMRGRRARPHPACADGPLAAHTGQDLGVVGTRSWLEAYAAEGRHRLRNLPDRYAAGPGGLLAGSRLRRPGPPKPPSNTPSLPRPGTQ